MFTQVFFPIHNIIMNDKVYRYCAFCLLIKPANYLVCACLSTHYIMFILGRLGCMYLPVMFIFIVFNILIIFHPLCSSYTPLLQNVIGTRIADSCRLLYLCIRCTDLHISTCIIQVFAIRSVRPQTLR
jgi:hypothetical protein